MRKVQERNKFSSIFQSSTFNQAKLHVSRMNQEQRMKEERKFETKNTIKMQNWRRNIEKEQKIGTDGRGRLATKKEPDQGSLCSSPMTEGPVRVGPAAAEVETGGEPSQRRSWGPARRRWRWPNAESGRKRPGKIRDMWAGFGFYLLAICRNKHYFGLSLSGFEDLLISTRWMVNFRKRSLFVWIFQITSSFQRRL